MDEERRLHTRYRLWLPARIEGRGEEARLAIGHDISQTGSLLVTNGALEVGAHIVLFVRVPPEGDDEQRVAARVVRSGPNEADPQGLWPFQIAVEFDEAAPALEALVREHAGDPRPESQPPESRP
jgi:hypothetical protein